uniref:Uncharacterized protein n=1 Tax=Cacopsylla melanoneura TaxID=428564 RepID=A0A8D8RD39_9HEMI
MLSPTASIIIMLNLVLMTYSALDSPAVWDFVVDPYTVKGIMDFKPFLDKKICAENESDTLCTEDLAAALKKGDEIVKSDDSLRKGCDFDNNLKQKVCWIRKVQGVAIGSWKKTVFEFQFWLDTTKNKSHCRYNYPHGDK